VSVCGQFCSRWSESECKHQELGSESVDECTRRRWFSGPRMPHREHSLYRLTRYFRQRFVATDCFHEYSDRRHCGSCASVRPYVCLSVRPSVRLSVCPSVCLSVRPSVLCGLTNSKTRWRGKIKIDVNVAQERSYYHANFHVEMSDQGHR